MITFFLYLIPWIICSPIILLLTWLPIFPIMHCWPFSIILKNELLFTTSITIICTKVISRDYFIRFMLPIVYMKNNIVGNTILFFPWTSITIVHSSFTVWCVCWQKKLLFQSVFDCHFSKQNTNNCFYISFSKREKYNF